MSIYKIIFVFVLTVKFNQASYGQAPDTIWQKVFGGTDNELMKNIEQTSDGGYIAAGWTSSNNGDISGNHGGIDYWVTKLTPTGDISWQKCVGGSLDEEGDENIGGMIIHQTTDGGYILSASTLSNDGDVTNNHGGKDYWVVKMNSTGDIVWQKTLGGSGLDEATGVKQTFDGGYIVIGNSTSRDGDVTTNHGSSDYWIVKIDNSGNIMWQKSFGGSNSDNATSVEQTKDTGYIVAGYSDSEDGDITDAIGNWDYWILKLDSFGNIQWKRNYGGTDEDYATCIKLTSDGGFIMSGYTYSSDVNVTTAYGDFDVWITKLSFQGDIEWEKSLGGTSIDGASSIQQTTDENYIISSGSYSNDIDVIGNHGGFDAWLVKLSNTGNIIWQKL